MAPPPVEHSDFCGTVVNHETKKTIYLVEDPLLAQLMSAYLLTVFRGDLQVEKFSSFETAVARFDSSHTRPAVVYGAMMQGNGVSLCSRLKALDSSVRFILASGAPPGSINEALLQERCFPDAVLHKPFSLEQVQAVLRELLPGRALLPLGMSKSGVWPFYRLVGVWKAHAALPKPSSNIPSDTLSKMS